DLAKKIISITKQINELLLDETAHTLQNLKIRNYTQGNRAGKALATLLRQKQAQSKIPYLHNHTGGKTHDPREILAEMANFYDTLYNIKQDPQTSTVRTRHPKLLI
ncbi:Hypothetical predicted protein, partial [Pelobates cultripes]